MTRKDQRSGFSQDLCQKDFSGGPGSDFPTPWHTAGSDFDNGCADRDEESATIVGDHRVIRSMIVIVLTRSTTEMDDGLRQGEKLRPAGSRSHASPSSRDDHRDYPTLL